MKYIEIFIESFGTYILLVLMIRFLGKKVSTFSIFSHKSLNCRYILIL